VLHKQPRYKVFKEFTFISSKKNKICTAAKVQHTAKACGDTGAKAMGKIVFEAK
jgi:hypothetical protein